MIFDSLWTFHTLKTGTFDSDKKLKFYGAFMGFALLSVFCVGFAWVRYKQFSIFFFYEHVEKYLMIATAIVACLAGVSAFRGSKTLSESESSEFSEEMTR